MERNIFKIYNLNRFRFLGNITKHYPKIDISDSRRLEIS